MSLLLDALKKAAEQKAEKAKAEGQPAGVSDESGLDLGPVDATVSQVDDGGRQSVSGSPPEDDTDLDLSRHTAHPGRNPETDGQGDDVDIKSESSYATLSRQMETGEDESIVFADDDIFEFMGDPRYISQDYQQDADPKDNTNLNQAAADGGSEQGLETASSAAADDDTDLNPADLVARANDGSLSYAQERADETDLGRAGLDRAQGEGEPQKAALAGDTDLSRTGTPRDAESGAIKMTLEPMTSRSIKAEADSTGAEDDPGVLLQGEDLSLLLRDEDNITAANVTSITEQKTDQSGLLRGDASYTLSQVDSGEEQRRTPDEMPTVSSTATSGAGIDTLTNEGITARAEPTSTRTYAPDNYDRTLMKLPGEDASRLFAGMKSDADVVMTPEYAKKVFQSKSSTHRLQYFKTYTGIIVAIILGIGVYGIFEIDREAGNIEANLRPLKQDPMPGTIKPAQEDTQNMFDDGSVDEQTIKLVESAAAETGVKTQAPERIETLVEPEFEATAESETAGDLGTLAQTETAETSDTTASETEASAPAQTKSRAGEAAEAPVVQSAKQTARKPDAAKTAEAAESNSDSTLQLSSSSRLGQEHQLLHEAYAAYRAGDDQLALQKYNRVLQIDPVNRNALLARAAINVQNNDVGAAIADYRRLLLANPKDSLAMTSLIAVANVSPVDAETQLKLMIRDEPESPYLNFALANAYGAQDRWREAQNHYFTALENNPGDPNYAYNLAVSLEHIAKPEVAVSYYRRALDNMKNGLAMFSKEVVDQRLEILEKL